MSSFRKQIPKRQNVTKVVSSYRDHKSKLEMDFNHRCGYCDCLDEYRNNFYEIDHFIPKRILKENSSSEAEYKDLKQKYTNLVYSCRSCNNAKGDKWPTENIRQPLSGNKGFIDPCNPQYDAQFMRNDDGEIIPVTDIGKWKNTELKLFNIKHSIIWKLEQISNIIQEIRKLPYNKNKNLQERLLDLTLKYFDYDRKLRSS
jgi:5-methylcytosine-specific restriction endonuclease McrA